MKMPVLLVMIKPASGLCNMRCRYLKEDTFEEIHQRRLASGFLENSRNHDEGCQKCRYFAVCRGGCRRQREVFGSVQEGARNILCEGYKMFFDKYYERMKEIAAMCAGRRRFPQPTGIRNYEESI